MDCIPRLLSRGQTFDALSSQVRVRVRVRDKASRRNDDDSNTHNPHHNPHPAAAGLRVRIREIESKRSTQRDNLNSKLYPTSNPHLTLPRPISLAIEQS
jgi:hypothetical protein